MYLLPSDNDIYLCSDWPLFLLWFWLYDTQSKSALISTTCFAKHNLLGYFINHLSFFLSFFLFFFFSYLDLLPQIPPGPL